MLYLKEFTFASIDSEEQFINYINQTVYSGFYPFGVLGYKSVYGNDPAGKLYETLGFSHLYSYWFRVQPY